MEGDHSKIVEKLAKKFWTPERVASFVDCGLHDLRKSIVFFIVTWTTIGLVVSEMLFAGSLEVVLLFYLVGFHTGLLLPGFLMFKYQEIYLTELRSADE